MAQGSRRNRPWTGLSLIALSIIFVLCLGSAAATKKGGRTTSESKLEHLAARGPIVTLADGNFTRYADGATRPYSIVVLFTALDPKYNCVSCRAIEGPLGKVAEAYTQQFDLRKTEHKVVFARIDIAKGGTTFKNLGITTAPRVFLVHQGKGFPGGAELEGFEVTRDMSRADGSVDEFLVNLGKVTGARPVIVTDSSGLLPAALLLGVAIGFLAHFVADVPSWALEVARHKGLWFAVSMGCYVTGVGGMVYCIIRNPKPYGFHQETGAPAFFSPGSRDQFWYEGLVVGILYLMMSAAVLGAYSAAGWKRVPSLLRTAVVLLCVTVLCYVASEYFALYIMKTTWYSVSEVLPPVILEFHKGPLKRKHGLLRRMVRLSHLWLNEYTGFRPFCSKFKTLLWDYLVRRLDATLGGWILS